MTYLGDSVEEVLSFMKKQHIRTIPGIGKINETIMAGMGIESCQDVIDKATELYINFSPNAF